MTASAHEATVQHFIHFKSIFIAIIIVNLLNIFRDFFHNFSI